MDTAAQTFPCIAFQMEDAAAAYRHLLADKETVIRYGARYAGKRLHTWDEGERILMRCKTCGGYYLLQDSEMHGIEYDRSYTDFFPVSGPSEAESLNRMYDGFAIETAFPERYLIQDDQKPPVWKHG